MHSRSTILPQLFHRGPVRGLPFVTFWSGIALTVAFFALLLRAPVAFAQAPSPGPTYRVFLKTGQGLPSYGQPAQVDDHMVFNLVIRQDKERLDLQLVSLPVASIDVERTMRYTETMRAAYYAATRGEVDYQAMTAEIGKVLEDLSGTADAGRRLALAEQAQQRLLDWAESSYHYRADDVDELSGLLDLVINELRASAGQSSFSLSLVARLPAPETEALLPAPTLDESIALAMNAAEVADNTDERIAILAATQAVVAADPGAAEFRDLVIRRMEDERRTAAQYAALKADVARRAETAVSRGDVKSLESLTAEIVERDRDLGQKRPTEMQTLLQEIQQKLEVVQAQQTRIDRYNAVRHELLAYEKRIRPALSGLDGLLPILRFIRDVQPMSYDRVANAEIRLERLLGVADGAAPPEDLRSVHSTIISALQMAREASTRRRLADLTARPQASSEASSAAAGAILLYEKGRQDLVRGLYPPKQE